MKSVPKRKAMSSMPRIKVAMFAAANYTNSLKPFGLDQWHKIYITQLIKELK